MTTTTKTLTNQAKIEYIANIPTRSEKTSWNRKLSNLMKIIEELTPIEDEILQLINEKKNPLMDALTELRTTMVQECIHPADYLVVEEDGSVRCKFCEKRIGINYDNIKS